MEGLSCTELANFMLDNGISESVIDNFVTNETTHSKNYYIFSMSKRSCQYTPNNTYNDCAVDKLYALYVYTNISFIQTCYS